MPDASDTAQTKKPLYEQSSQYRHWRFTSQELQQIRADVRDLAIERVKGNLTQDKEARSDAGEKEALTPVDQLDFLSLEDELALCIFYQLRIADICKAFQYGHTVRATATMYMKRFYLYNTVMDYHPKNVMLTCLFLATKTENHMTSIDKFVSKLPKTSPASVLELEFIISQSIRFEFLIHHPYRPCYGLFLDMQTIDSIAKSSLSEIYAKAIEHVHTSLYTDSCFIFQPSQIAMACFHLADAAITDAYLKVKFASSPESLATLSAIISDIEKTITDFVTPTVDQVRSIDRRLYFVQNPEKNTESHLYKKRKLEEQDERNDKSEKKAKLETSDSFEGIMD